MAEYDGPSILNPEQCNRHVAWLYNLSSLGAKTAKR